MKSYVLVIGVLFVAQAVFSMVLPEDTDQVSNDLATNVDEIESDSDLNELIPLLTNTDETESPDSSTEPNSENSPTEDDIQSDTPEGSEPENSQPTTENIENDVEDQTTEPSPVETTTAQPNPYITIANNQVALLNLRLQSRKLLLESNSVKQQVKNASWQCQSKIKTSFAKVKLEIATQKISNAPAECLTQAKKSSKIDEKAASKSISACKSQAVTGSTKPQIWLLDMQIRNLEIQNRAIVTNCIGFATGDNAACQNQLANTVKSEIVNVESQLNDLRESLAINEDTAADSITQCCRVHLDNAETSQQAITDALRTCVAAQGPLVNDSESEEDDK